MTSFEELLQSANNEPNKADEWRNKLIGRVVLDNDETSALQEDECVRKKDLPNPHRVLAPNSMATRDFRPERLNILVDHTMRVTGVHYG